jgi:membrane associated rhomboid family serine protease
VPNLGASGAIAGVLGAYLVLLPAARVIAFVPLFLFLLPVELPAALFLVFWFLFQLWQAGFSFVVPQAGGGIAFFAHIGGFLFGILAAHAFARRRVRAPAWY